MRPARRWFCLNAGMLRAVADAHGSLGENVTLPNGELKLGRSHVAVGALSNDAATALRVKVSREQLLIKFSSENKTCTVTRIGGALSRLVRADGGERIKISPKNAKHDLRPGDTLWIMEHTDGATYGGYVFEPVAPPAAPAPPVVPAAPAAPAPLAPIAAEDSVGTPAPFEKHLLGSNYTPTAGADASGGGGRGSGGKGSGGGGRSRDRDACHFCGEIGHWASECPKNPNRAGKGSGSRDGGGGSVCYNCGMTGHYKRDCPAPRKDSAEAAAKAKKALEEEAAAKAAAEAAEAASNPNPNPNPKRKPNPNPDPNPDPNPNPIPTLTRAGTLTRTRTLDLTVTLTLTRRRGAEASGPPRLDGGRQL